MKCNSLIAPSSAMQSHLWTGIMANLAAGTIPVIHSRRWGLRNRRTGTWFAPIDHVRMHPYPLSFDCRAGAEATLDRIGNASMWEAAIFSDADYEAAIAASGGIL